MNFSKVFVIIFIFIFFAMIESENKVSLRIFADADIPENFENKETDTPDSSMLIDKKYAKLFDTVFNEKDMFSMESKKLSKFITRYKKRFKNIKLLEAGTGTGKYYMYLSQKYKTVGLDRSKYMLERCRIRNPIGTFVMKDFMEDKAFKSESFSHILCLNDTIYHNKRKNWNTIFSNFYYWLKPGGFLIIHIYDNTKLDPTPRNWSRIVFDKDGTKHAITNFSNFIHNSWWKKESENSFTFNEIYTFGEDLDNAKKKYYKHKLYIPPKEKIIKAIVGNYFKLLEIKSLSDMDIDDHEIYFFEKIR